mmetsp:Transcript_25961/g.56270  ORF Transcript_25961/g.56270 Transcript_25961/m.56270 type:complete len:80 (+) Transcript_25961:951-1190(+)
MAASVAHFIERAEVVGHSSSVHRLLRRAACRRAASAARNPLESRSLLQPAADAPSLLAASDSTSASRSLRYEHDPIAPV